MQRCLTWCETQTRAQKILRFSRFCRAFALSLFSLFLACQVNAEEKAEPERRYAVNIPKQNLADAIKLEQSITTDGPLQQEEKENKVKQENAEDNIKNNESIKNFMTKFDATIKEKSIKPIN